MSTQGSTTDLRERVRERAAAPAQRGPTLNDELQSLAPQITAALGAMVDPVRFIRTALTETRKNPQLLDCERTSFLGAVLASAQLGLEFGPLGLAYLVPFWNGKAQQRECQLIVGYRGYIDLARRSGTIKNLVARPVYENDEFKAWTDEGGDHLLHVPIRGSDKGTVKLYYGLATFVNGGSYVEVMELSEIEERMKRGQSWDSSFSPWKSDFEAMARKTVVRKMRSWLPLTTEVASNLAADEAQVHLRHGELLIDQTPLPPADETALPGSTGAPDNAPDAPTAGTEPPEAPGATTDAVDGDSGESSTVQEPLTPPGEPQGDDRTSESDLDALASSTKATVDAMNEKRLNDTEGQFGLAHTGSMATRRLRLYEVLVRLRREGDPAATALF